MHPPPPLAADPEGLEPDLAAGLRKISHEGLGAPLEDLEVHKGAGGEDEDEDEEDEAAGESG